MARVASPQRHIVSAANGWAGQREAWLGVDGRLEVIASVLDLRHPERQHSSSLRAKHSGWFVDSGSRGTHLLVPEEPGTEVVLTANTRSAAAEIEAARGGAGDASSNIAGVLCVLRVSSRWSGTRGPLRCTDRPQWPTPRSSSRTFRAAVGYGVRVQMALVMIIV